VRISVSLKPNKTYSLEDLYDLGHTTLHPLAYLFGLPPWSVEDLPKALRRRLLNLSIIHNIYSSLGAPEKAILEYLARHPGCPVLKAPIVDALAKSMPRRQIEQGLNFLTGKGWLISGANPETYLLVSEITLALPHLPTFHNLLIAEKPPDAISGLGSDDWLRDFVTVSSFLYTNRPKLTARRLINKQSLRRLMPKLSHAAAEEWESAYTEHCYPYFFNLILSMIWAMAVPVEPGMADENTVPVSLEAVRKFLCQPPEYRLAAAVSRLVSHLANRNETNVVMLFDIFRAANPLGQRWQTAYSILEKCGNSEAEIRRRGNDPISAEAWVAGVFLKPLAYLGLTENGIGQVEASWVENGYIEREFWRLTPAGKAFARWLETIRQPFSLPAELSNVSLPDAGGSNRRLADLLAAWREILPRDLERELIVQPDLSVIVPRTAAPWLLWVLTAFADIETKEYIYQGRFCRETVLSALKAGLSFTDLADALRRHSKIEPNEAVWRTLMNWAEAFDQTLFAKAVVLALATPEMAAETAAHTKLAAWIVGRSGPRTLIIVPEGEPAVRKWLEKKGWVPKPGFADGRELGAWLASRESS